MHRAERIGMGDDDTLFGLSRGTQVAIIAVLGGALIFLGLAGSSAVDPEYDPLTFGVGLVMFGYAAVVGALEWLRE